MKEFSFAKRRSQSDTTTAAPLISRPWRLLIVDDDEEVHAVTRLALRKIQFRHRALELISAHSAKEALETLRNTDDIAMVLLDVVMETNDAGLRLARQIREELGNGAVRIILRTGQPGEAPEERIIVDYDINDYKAKAELTAQKLFTAVIVALRGYSDVRALERNADGLRTIIEASDSLMKKRSMHRFASGVLTQLSALLSAGPKGVVCIHRGHEDGALQVLAATGNPDASFEVGQEAITTSTLKLEANVMAAIHDCFESRESKVESGHAAIYLGDGTGGEIVALLLETANPEEIDRTMIELFSRKIAVGFENVALYEQVQKQNENLEHQVADRTRALAEANVELEQLANTDALTSIANRRSLVDHATRSFSAARRYNHPLSLAMVDIDHFKNINDLHGHAIGDAVLRNVAQTLKSELRNVDVVGRIGGEEFAIVFDDTALESALMTCERLREVINATTVMTDAGSVGVTLSFGLVTLDDEDDTIDQMMSRADRMLYRAKDEGRDCIAALLADGHIDILPADRPVTTATQLAGTPGRSPAP